MSEEDHRTALELLAQLSFETSERLQERAAEAGLSMQQARLLGILRDREPTINDLTTHLRLDKSSVSGLVIRAERRGLVSRIQHESDGRAVRVRLEPPGRALIDAANARFEEDMRDFFTTLDDAERRQWTAMTARLLTAEAERRRSAL